MGAYMAGSWSIGREFCVLFELRANFQLCKENNLSLNYYFKGDSALSQHLKLPLEYVCNRYVRRMRNWYWIEGTFGSSTLLHPF